MSVVLLSPLSGWVAGLRETPDEAFAEGALGDGVVIDPTEGRLHAPCDGHVITLAATGHAIAIRSVEGAEVLLHVGVDSVALKGEGFWSRVSVGQAVKAGDRLLDFDLDVVARGARSLITPVLIANGERFDVVRRAQGRVPTGEFLLELKARAVAPTANPVDRSGAATIHFVTGLAEGVHARPAARIVAAARAAGGAITVGAHGRTASALSVLGLMGLAIRRGDAVTLWADEPTTWSSVQAAFDPMPVPTPSPDVGPERLTSGVLFGVGAAPGLAVGEAFRHAAAEIEPPPIGEGVAAEARALLAALTQVRRRLEVLADAAPGVRGDILQAHLALLDDPALRDAATAAIEGGASAGAAWRTAIRRQVDLLAMSADRRIGERRADLIDLERQGLAELYGAAEASRPPPGAVVLAEDLLPSELAAFADLSIAGVAMAGGGATSHVAIMAAALGLPMLVAVQGLSAVTTGTPVILDADAGRLIVAPDRAVVAEMQDRGARRTRRRHAALTAAADPGVTTDGLRIAVYANLGGVQEVERAVAQGAEGCGLLRSEFLFQDRSTAPDETEQHAAYQAVADRLQGRPLTIRTLDIGGDKPAPYLALPAEENPALGLRGVRASLWRPDLLRSQLRAILRVRGEVAVLVPMVAAVAEIAAVGAMLREEAAALGRPPPPLGVMVETPAAALTVETLAEEAVFFSIGANDLTQYALAMDRTSPLLADRTDGLHPAVVTLMRLAARAALAKGCKVSVCGGLAADRAAVPLLIGLGVTELSLPPGEIAETKALIRTLSAADCRAFADAGATYADAGALRHALLERWPQVGDAP